MPDSELVSHLREADLAVFPYREVSSSGAAIFALSAGRPILASDQPAFRELQSIIGGDWVTLYDGELTANVLEAAARRARRLICAGGAPSLNALSWETIADQTIEFYEAVCES